jgi:hypothetical protein
VPHPCGFQGCGFRVNRIRTLPFYAPDPSSGTYSFLKAIRITTRYNNLFDFITVSCIIVLFLKAGGRETGRLPVSAPPAGQVLRQSFPHYVVTSLLRSRLCALGALCGESESTHDRLPSIHFPVTPVESADPKNAPVTPLQSADPKTKHLKSFRIRRSENRWGEGTKC